MDQKHRQHLALIKNLILLYCYIENCISYRIFIFVYALCPQTRIYYIPGLSFYLCGKSFELKRFITKVTQMDDVSTYM